MIDDECRNCINGDGCFDFIVTRAKDCEFFKPENEWISVEERLPEENEKVLIICKNKAMFVADYYLFTNSDEQVWRTYGALGKGRRVATNRITHWQPLPKPPTEQ